MSARNRRRWHCSGRKFGRVRQTFRPIAHLTERVDLLPNSPIASFSARLPEQPNSTWTMPICLSAVLNSKLLSAVSNSKVNIYGQKRKCCKVYFWIYQYGDYKDYKSRNATFDAVDPLKRVLAPFGPSVEVSDGDVLLLRKERQMG